MVLGDFRMLRLLCSASLLEGLEALCALNMVVNGPAMSKERKNLGSNTALIVQKADPCRR